jgi:hypothetical protein
MADLTSVCNGLATVLDTIPGLRVSSGFTSQVNPPMAVVMPQPSQSLRFDTMGGGISYLLRVVLLAQYAQDSSSVNQLNSYLATTGQFSVAATILANPRLGGAAESVNMDSVRGYGLMEWAGQQYLGAQILVTVLAT